METKKSGYDECVGFTRLLMKIIGIWPGVESSPKRYEQYVFLIPLFFLAFFIIIPQTRMLLNVTDDLNNTIEILTTADVITMVAFFKLLVVWYNKRDLRCLLIDIEKDWAVTEKNQQYPMWENVKIGKYIIHCYASLVNGTLLLYTITMLLLINTRKIEDYNNGNITKNRLMYLRSKFHFETEGSPTYEIIWILQFLATFICGAAFTCFDGFFILSILHVCAQLVNLQFNFRNLVPRYQSSKHTFAQLLSILVQRHVHIQSFTKIIEDNFNKVFLMQMIGYSITLCLQGYQLVLTLTENSEQNFITIAFIIVYTSANMSSLFVYCFIAEKLRIESTNIYYAVYDMHWHKINPNESKMLVILMQATQNPLEITAGKFAVLSFEYFIKVLKTAVGYLSMLLAVKSRTIA